ncbi:MAG: FAD-binding protein [Gammaproteobacteria bacterium]|nr:MAG: FAD-binding protein [Gammaproteobacteria bacterium]
MALDPSILSKFIDACGKDSVLTNQGECWAYGYDNSKQHTCPDLVLLPQQHEQIQQAVKICNEHKLPLTARGRGTGTTGAAVPIQAGVVLSTEHMNQILEFDYKNRNIRVEPGVLNVEVQKQAAEQNLFWPPDPSSADYCSIGGNLACNAAGPRAVKYGTCRENTLSLTAITGAGETIHTGSATTKGVVGLDLTRLLIGSEGILGIITEARLKLSPRPECINTIRALYKNSSTAIEAVVNILAQSALPHALEFIDSGSLNLIRKNSNLILDKEAQAMLMIEVDGLNKNIQFSAQAILKAANIAGCIDIQDAADEQQKAALWAARKALSPALRSFAPNKINEDVVVPVTQLPTLLSELEKLSNKHNIAIFNFGHAGNGNLHVNLLYDANKQEKAAKNCLNEVFELVLKLGGTLSGEHGIGIAKRDYVSQEIDATTLALMQKIKQQFDPNNILNPGKTLPD